MKCHPEHSDKSVFAQEQTYTDIKYDCIKIKSALNSVKTIDLFRYFSGYKINRWGEESETGQLNFNCSQDLTCLRILSISLSGLKIFY